MRDNVILAGTVAALLAHAGVAAAQTFPADGAYVPLPCGDAPMTDRFADEPGALDERDLVGDRDHAAGLRAVDDDFLYLRIRLDQDAIPGGTVRPFAWGVEFDLDDDRGDYELLALVDGVSGNVLVFRNTQTGQRDDPTDPADTPAALSYPIATHAKATVAGGTDFGNDADHFLSLALPWADLAPLGLERDTPVRVWVASSSTANALDGDFACHDGGSGDATFVTIGGDRTVLDPDVDSDGDGVSDADEVEGGSNPNDPGSVPQGGENAFAGGGGCAVGGAAGAGAAWLLAGALLVLARRRRR